MIDKIVSSFEPIALMGGMGAARGTIEAVSRYTSGWVAADGGARHVVEAGIMPRAVIGDLDSVAGTILSQLDPHTVHRIEEQDSTDFEKCLLRIEAPLVLACGMLGGRLDHQLVALHALMRFSAQRCVLVGETEIVFLCPPRIRLPFEPQTPVSLFPLGHVVADTVGLQWSFEQLALEPGGRVGTSNIALGCTELSVSAPALLCIVPRDCLDVVVTQLAEEQGGWSARS